MKRKNQSAANGKAKKRAISDDEAHQNFREGLFGGKVLKGYSDYYATSQPYKHAVIQNLVNDKLLRNVRDEIREHISFTPKETDIYKIHQSGDLANLDGLDDSALRRLPSLLTLRDSLYSSAFRKYLSSVTDSGPLSGVKTDMANVYTPGCHLLCHDDVIGSRRVSWILYLLDPDRPWKPEWGGALRLYPTEHVKTSSGDMVKVPQPDYTVSIPPAWNQLSFFTVQPGESFHDVEEVYKRTVDESEEDGGRVRMAISGWFHIPQKGEDGFEEGLEEKLAEKSSLAQLQGGKADEFDEPKPHWVDNPDWEEQANDEDQELTADEIDFLIKYMNPNYLTPDTVEELSGMFSDESSLRLAEFLSVKFSTRLRAYLETKDREPNPSLPANPLYKESRTGVARPPHKHRYLYREAVQPIPTPYPDTDALTPYDDLVDILLPHPAFTKWISLVTGITLTKSNIYARRFRRGVDYTLATAYEEEDPQLEVCLNITPSRGWGDEDEEPEEEEESGAASSSKSNGKAPAEDTKPEEEVGGYEMYMAGDDDDDAPGGGPPEPSTSTGAGQRRKAKAKADPAVYKSARDEEDDGVLFSQPASWNNMSVVLRDKGVLRFTKYVSRSANGDRWDICADYGVEFGEDDDDEDE
ncbi:Oxoglutarate and iron-dependent oxygenase degradation C-term-domain-containing protein [Massariosphaeria phaeospora]|uniref:uS12 prolyl 3,4-dihydroxylase n=1 Tax=Massariosphaeria phaeospora TaxID=100035 RepID=A0A7C8IE68_9PLEO|nr:Oxoglutarate and iron-dependent oxygenase degradation C-term-domain-containing protein [Massariosphaeria phaeospora]